MSLEFEPWQYEGSQWDNVPKVVPTMFRKCEKIIQNIFSWIQQQKFEEKLKDVLVNIEKNQKKIMDVEQDLNLKINQNQQFTLQEIQNMNQRFQYQEEIIKRLERRLQMRDFLVEEDVELNNGYMQLNNAYQKYFKYPKENKNSNAIDAKNASKKRIEQNTNQSHLGNKIYQNNRNSFLDGSQKDIIINNTQDKQNTKENKQNQTQSKQQINDQITIQKDQQSKQVSSRLIQSQGRQSILQGRQSLLQNEESVINQQNQILQEESIMQNEADIDDENFQYENQYIIWKMINASISQCYLNNEISKFNEIISNQEKQLKNEINNTKGKIDSSNNLISQVDFTIKEQQKMNENKFDKIFSYNLDKFSNKLERGLQDIEILQQSKILIETLDSKYDEKCNVLHSEIQYAHKRIDEVKLPFESNMDDIKLEILKAKQEYEEANTQITVKINEKNIALSDKISSGLDNLTVKMESVYKEYKTSIEQQNVTIKTNQTVLNKNITTFRSDIINDIEKLEIGLSDTLPRIKEFQQMVLEIQKQLLDIAEMEHIKFNENLQQKMSIFITNIWKKADKTEIALEKLIDSLIEHQQYITSMTPDDAQNNLQIPQVQLGQSLSPKIIDNVVCQTQSGQDKRDLSRNFNVDEGEEFNDDHEDRLNSNHYPLIHLKSLGQNYRAHTQESQNDSPHFNLKYNRLEKDQIRLKKLQYINACKEHNITFSKALNLETSILSKRQSKSSQKSKRPHTVQGSTTTGFTKAQVQHQNDIKNTNYENQQQQFTPFKKLENLNNPIKLMTNKINDYNISQNQGSQSQSSENQDYIFNQSIRTTHSQNRKRAISQSKTKHLNNNMVIFNTNNPLGDSHYLDSSSGNTTNNNNNSQFNFGVSINDNVFDNSSSPMVHSYTKNQSSKKKENDQNLHKNLIDIKLKFLKKAKTSIDQYQLTDGN